MAKTILVTGASGKVGRNLIPALINAGHKVRAMRHSSPLPFTCNEEITGSIADKEFVMEAVAGVDVICQLATTKENFNTFVDISIKGTINLLEACRSQSKMPHFILAGGDAALGIFFYPRPYPLTEISPKEAYPGCYALSKVMEEVLCEQYSIQYGIPYTNLRCSWIMENDDLLSHITIKPPQFGGPYWKSLASTIEQKSFFENGQDAAVNLTHSNGASFIRHVVAIEDVVEAFTRAIDNAASIGQTFNIASPAPFSYKVVSEYVANKLDIPVLTLTSQDYYDFSIDTTKMRTVLGCVNHTDAFAMIDKGIAYKETHCNDKIS